MGRSSSLRRLNRGWRNVLRRQKRPTPKQPKVLLEALEPRVLLSSDLVYAALADVDLTVQLDPVDATTVQVVETGSGDILASEQLDNLDGSSGYAVRVDAAGFDVELTVDASVIGVSQLLDAGGIVFEGSTGSATLIGPDVAAQWAITDTGAGFLESGAVRFGGVENLLGGGDSDQFVLIDGGRVVGTIDGGEGSDELLADDADNTWILDGIDAGTLFRPGGSVPDRPQVEADPDGSLHFGDDPGTAEWLDSQAFSSVENLVGGSLRDEFVFAEGAEVSGTIDGGGGPDLLDYSFRASDTAVDLSARNDIEEIRGGSGSDTLIGLDADSVWAITGSDTGHVRGALFTGFENLFGGAGQDEFVFHDGGAITGLLDGGAGQDTLVGSDAGRVWVIAGADVGTVGGQEFADIENLTGGSGNDDFYFTPAGVLSGTLDGGEGDDSVDFSDVEAAVVVQLLGASQATGTPGVRNVRSITGSGGGDTLAATDSTHTWTITGVNAGEIDGLEFAGFENLLGGAGNDLFEFVEGGLLDGNIVGGGGDDTLDYSGYTSGIVVDLASDVAPALAGFEGIQHVVGGSGQDELIGPAEDTVWMLDGVDAGAVAGILFSGFENLSGAADNEDTFVLEPMASISGIISGGDFGFDTVVVAEGDYSTVAFVVTGPDSGRIDRDGAVVAYSGMEPVHGGSADNIVFTSEIANDVIVLEDDGANGMRITWAGETHTFGNPANSLTIRAHGTGTNSITIQSLDPAFNPTVGLTLESGVGNDTLTVESLGAAFAGELTFIGGPGDDVLEGIGYDTTYVYGDDWGNDTINDPGGEALLQFAGFTGDLRLRAPSDAAPEVEGIVAGSVVATINYSGAATFVTDIGILDSDVQKQALTDGLDALSGFGHQLDESGLLGTPLFLLSGRSIGEFLDIGEILDSWLAQPVDDFLDTDSDPTLDELLDVLIQAGITDASGTLVGDVLTLDLGLQADRTTTGVALGLGGDIEEFLVAEDLTGDLTTTLAWVFSVGVDATDNFFGIFDTDVEVTAVVNLPDAEFAARAGFLDLDVGAVGADQSSIALNADVTVDPGGLDADPANGSVSQDELVNGVENVTQAGMADVEMTLHATVPGVAGVTVPSPLLTFTDDVFDDVDAVFDDTAFQSSPLADFYKTTASAIRNQVRQFGSFFDRFDESALNVLIPLTQGQTFADIFDLEAVFREEFLDLIELPPHTATTPIEELNRGEGVGTVSGDDIEVQLRGFEAFRVDLDSEVPSIGGPATTLGHFMELIRAAATDAGVSEGDFEVKTNQNGSLTLVDYTEATVSDAFKIVNVGEESKAATHLSLDSPSIERDVNGDGITEFVIDVAPNPGANFDTVQEMVSLATPGTNTTITDVVYTDGAEPKLSFLLGIAKTLDDVDGKLGLFDLGPLTDLVSDSTLIITGPTVTLNLPFEVELTTVGFDSPLAESTLLSSLNRDIGVRAVVGGADIHVQLIDGTSFAVDLDPHSIVTEDLNDGLGVRTDASGADIEVQLSDGTSFQADLDPATTLGELVQAIRDWVPDSVADGDFEARIDIARGQVILVDRTSGSFPFAVSNVGPVSTAASDLGLDVPAVPQDVDGETEFVIESSVVTLGNLVQLIRDAAPGTLVAEGLFDVRIDADSSSLTLVDNTEPGPALSGTVTGTGFEGDNTLAGQDFGPDDSLVGREVTLIPADTDASRQTLMIIGNTTDTLTLEAAWEIPPEVGDTYEIPTTFVVAARNDSFARVDLGLFGAGLEQRIKAETPLDEANGWLGVRTLLGENDIRVTLRSGASFDVNLDHGPGDTLAMLASKIETAAGALVTDGDFEVLTDENTGKVSLLDRSAQTGATEFTVMSLGASTAASDLKLDVASEERDVDFDGEDDGFVIDMGSPALLVLGGPLHGDTASAHFRLGQNAFSHIHVSTTLSASGIEASGLWGALAVDVTGGEVDPVSTHASFEVMLNPASLRELTEGLSTPQDLIGSQSLAGSLYVTLDLQATPAVSGVADDPASLEVTINDIADENEVVSPAFTNSNDMRSLLESVEFLTAQDSIGYLDAVADYLLELETQSDLASRLPGLSRSLGEVLEFGRAFKDLVAELDEEAPESLQAIKTALEALSSDISVEPSFDTATSELKFDLDITVPESIDQQPLTLDLTTLGQDLTALGLKPASVIVDSQRSSPLAVTTSGAIRLDLGIDLIDPASPEASLLDNPSETLASFDFRAEGLPLIFDALFGSMTVSVVNGYLYLDADGDPGTADPATYTVDLIGDQSIPSAFVNSSVTVDGQLQVSLPLEFPESVVPSPEPLTDPMIHLSITDVGDPAGTTTLTTNLDGTDWPRLSDLLGGLSLLEDLDGFKLGFDELFMKLDDLLDKAVFGQELPVVGTQLTEAADFIDRMRRAVSDTLVLRSGNLTPDIVQQTLFDALGPGGLGWLVDRNGDGGFNAADDIGLTAGASEVKFELDLMMEPQRLSIPVDVDLLLPGLGLEADALAEVEFGFSMPLTFGMSLAEGVFIDLFSEIPELTMDLQVALPTAVATLQDNPRILFSDNGADPHMIVREKGSWILDGFKVGHVITVEGSGSNDGDFVIAAIDPTGLALALDGTHTVNAEGPVDGITIEVKRVSMTGNPTLTFTHNASSPDTITRDTGSWFEDGFRVGQTISVEIAGSDPQTFAVAAIDPTQKILKLAAGDSVIGQTADGVTILSDGFQGFTAKMGALPFRVWDALPDSSELTGAYTVDLLDDAGNVDGRLTRNELMSALPGEATSPGPVPGLLTLTTIPALTNGEIHLKLETDLPPGTAFPPYRMDLNITGWEFSVSDSSISDIAPTIAFDEVQFELVAFMRDFAGAAVGRLRTAFEPLDGHLDFLTSAAFPILSYFFGRTSYISAAEIFDGEVEVGNFAGAADAIRTLVDGGTPDVLRGVNLPPIAQLTGEAWIDIGSFTVDGAAARSDSSSGPLAPLTSSVREFGNVDDAPLALTGSPELIFDAATNTIFRKNAEMMGSDKTLTFSTAPGVLSGIFGTITRLDGNHWSADGFRDGHYITIEGSTNNDKTFYITNVDGSTLTVFATDFLGGLISDEVDVTVTSAVGNTQTWRTDGFQPDQSISIEGSGDNDGPYTVASVSDTLLTLVEPIQSEGPVDDVVIDATNPDGTRATILGQIVAFSQDPEHSAYAAANSFLVTQLLPGKDDPGFLLAGGLTSEILKLAGISDNLEPIKYPIVEDASKSFDLLLGDTRFVANDPAQSLLIEYGTPEMRVALYQDFPLSGWWKELPGAELVELAIIIASGGTVGLGEAGDFISITFEWQADFAMAFDTTGLELFRATENPADIVEGLYFDDHEGIEPNPAVAGGNEAWGLGAQSFVEDEAQARFLVGLGYGTYAELNFIGLKVALEARLLGGGDWNFNDPDGDGKVRASEFDRNLTEGSVNVFDTGVRIEARLDFRLVVNPFGLFPLFDLNINLVTFGWTIGLPHDDVSAPVLAEFEGSTLFLNIGDGAEGRASQRLYQADVVDEEIFIGADSARNRLIVSGFGDSNVFALSSITKIVGYAGSGEDFIRVSDQVTTPVELHGGTGNDTLIVAGRQAIHQLFGDEDADYLEGSDGNDELHGGSGDDLIFGGRGRDRIFGDSGNDAIDGGPGDDVIEGGDDVIEGEGDVDVILGRVGRDTLRGGPGQDRIEGGEGADTIHGGDDSDVLRGGFDNDTIYGGGGADDIFGDQHNDLIYGGPGKDDIDGGGASDRIFGDEDNDVIKSREGNDYLDGVGGDDTYLLSFQGGRAASLVTVLDTGDALGTDSFVAAGTVFDDQFLLRANADGSIAFVAMLNDVARVERINYRGVESIEVNGGLGEDHFAVDDTAAVVTLNGDADNDTFQIGQLFRTQRTNTDANVAVDDRFATIETTRGFLSNGISAPMVINGGVGDDNFVVFHNRAVLSLNGDLGEDNFDVRAFALVGSQEPQRQRTDISGGADADRVQYAVNAPVNIDGGDGQDSLTVIGTEFGDDFVITEAGVFGAGLTVNFVNIERLKVDGAEGDDRFYVQSTSENFVTELFGGLGSDTFNMSGDTPPVVSNDLRGHSGLILHDVESFDPRFDEQALFGISANVADNDEPFVVIRQTDGSTIVTEGGSLIDTYEVILTRRPDTDVFIKALAPTPTQDSREKRALDFRLTSPSPTSVTTDDGIGLTLVFTPENWFIPQVVEVRADGATMEDLAGRFTRPELGDDSSFSFDDDAFEGVRFGVINHLALAASDSVKGKALAITASPTMTILNPNNRAPREFVGQTITVTGNGTEQERLITGAEIIAGELKLTVDRAWLTGSLLPDASGEFVFVVELDGGTEETGNPVAVTNPTIRIAEPESIPTTELLGRRIEIVGGSGAGQVRFIVDAEPVPGSPDEIELTVDRGWVLTDLPRATRPVEETQTQVDVVFHPNVLSFSFDVDAETITGDGLLRLTAFADLNASFEFLTLDAEGLFQQEVFVTGGRQFSQVTTELNLSRAQLEALADDGTIEITVTPSAEVDDLSRWYDAPSELTLDLALPLADSEFLVRIDDALVGKMTAFNPTPVLPPIPDSDDDERSTFTDSETFFPVPTATDEGLTGAIVEIVGGPGAGQQRLILGHLDSDLQHTLILNGGWNINPIPGESVYRIERYDGIAIPSVQVQVNDNDAGGIVVDETRAFENTDAEVDESDVVDDLDTITAVIEGGDGDHLGEQDVLQVQLSRAPEGPPGSTVEVWLSIRRALGAEDGDTQLQLTTLDGTVLTSPIDGASVAPLVFDATNWSQARTVRVEADNDELREGFHTGLIEFAITAADPANQDTTVEDQTDTFTIDPANPVELVGLSHEPIEGGIISVKHNNIALVEGPVGTPSSPAFEVRGSKILFRNEQGGFAKLSGKIEVVYDYTRLGFDGAATQPVLTRISDDDSPTVLVRETGRSTDVIEADPATLALDPLYDRLLTQANEVFAPNVLTFSFDVGSLTPIGDGVLVVSAFADLNWHTEFLTLDAEGIVRTLFVDDGLQQSRVATSVDLSQAELEQLAADGEITFTLTPSNDVNNLGPNDVSLQLAFPAAIVSSQSQIQTDNVFWPNVLTFGFDVASLQPTGDGVLTISAFADLDTSSEFLTLNAEGVFALNLFVTDGAEQSRVTTSISITEAELEELSADGEITFSVTPSSAVHDLGYNDLSLMLTFPTTVRTETVHQDRYQLVLTAEPTDPVTVTVTPDITKTTRTGGIRHDAVQVAIASDDLRVQPELEQGIPTGNLIVTFDATNWDDPVDIVVKAIDDVFVDGGDTKEFAPGPNTVSGILGPVFIEGGRGDDSPGIGPPVMLPGEDNVKPETGHVAAPVSDTLVTVFTDDLEEILDDLDLAAIDDLVEKTLEITAVQDPENLFHSAIGQFRLITGVTEGEIIDGEETTILTINEPYDLNLGGNTDEQESDIKSYAVTTESFTFFVDEATQVDYMFVHDEDSPADSSGVLTSTRLYGLNMGPDLVISGRLRPGGITYGALEVLEIDLGRGNNDFTVLGTPTGNDDFRTWTFLNTGSELPDPPRYPLAGDTVTVKLNAVEETTATGTVVVAANEPTRTTVTLDLDEPVDDLAGQLIKTADQTRRIIANNENLLIVDRPWVTVPTGEAYEIINEADGEFVLNTQGGDDKINASASDVPLVLFGGDGDDEIKGGTADDVIFGDRGRIDYIDDNGMIVTRLGMVREIIDPQAVTSASSADPAFDDQATLTDVNADFPLINEGARRGLGHGRGARRDQRVPHLGDSGRPDRRHGPRQQMDGDARSRRRRGRHDSGPDRRGYPGRRRGRRLHRR
jgi:Ca2+-binding RTX toxin-like protein